MISEIRDRRTFVRVVDASGLSDRELARRAQLGHATVNHLVVGRRSSCAINTARAIEAALGQGVGTLFRDVPA